MSEIDIELLEEVMTVFRAYRREVSQIQGAQNWSQVAAELTKIHFEERYRRS